VFLGLRNKFTKISKKAVDVLTLWK